MTAYCISKGETMSNNALTNKALGYPADARLLIVNGDDFGMCQAINQGILQAISEGIVQSCTLMTPCPWALHAIHLLQENPEISFGVHLTAVSEAPYYRWGPLTPADKVPSLIDEAGYFYNEVRIGEFLAQVSLSELELEFRAQIEAVMATGLTPTHVDSHCGIHYRRADIFDMTTGLAREYGLAMRAGQKSFIDKLQQQGLATQDYEILDSYRLDTGDKPEVYFKRLQELPPGLTEWAVHPALVTPELQAMSDSWEVREADYGFATSPETKRLINAEGIILLDYRPLQALWREMSRS
jgi:predicted glycoside hydrolase/deacetylase ChbG (UPF0249 family)